MKNTLFDQLGGTKGISRIVDDAVEAHMNNPMVSARFLPYQSQPEKLSIIKQHSIEFFSMGSGVHRSTTVWTWLRHIQA